jgi:hypothetical protein
MEKPMPDDTQIAVIPKNSKEDVVVSLGIFKEHKLLGVRVFADYRDEGDKKPTPKGISVKATLIPELIEALQDAEAEARRRGWLGHGA